MKYKLIICSAALLSVSSLSYGHSLHSMDKRAIESTFTDKTITTLPFTTIDHKLMMNRVSIYFGTNGKLVGKFAKKPENNYPQTDEGTWLVRSSGELCLTWQHWSEGKESCSYAYDMKNSFIFSNMSGYLDSVLLNHQIKQGNKVAELKSVREMIHEKRMHHQQMQSHPTSTMQNTQNMMPQTMQMQNMQQPQSAAPAKQ